MRAHHLTRAAGLATLALVAALAPARAANVRDTVDLLSADVRDLQARMADLTTRQEELVAQIQALRQELGLGVPGRRSPADLAARMDSVDTDMSVLFERQNETSSRLGMLTDKVTAVIRQQQQQQQQQQAMAAAAWPPPTAPAPSTDAAPPSIPPSMTTPTGPPAVAAPVLRSAPDIPPSMGRPTPSASPRPPEPEMVPLVDPEELYQEARSDYGRGSYDMAIAGFREFVQRFPDSELADNAQYWVGECLYSQQQWEAAAAEFDAVVARHPQGDKAADARYKKALCLLEMNRTADGILELQAVKDAHPDSAAAKLARQKLESLGLM